MSLEEKVVLIQAKEMVVKNLVDEYCKESNIYIEKGNPSRDFHLGVTSGLLKAINVVDKTINNLLNESEDSSTKSYLPSLTRRSKTKSKK